MPTTRSPGAPLALPLPLLACALALAACRSAPEGSYYVHPNADLSTYQEVAILPLGNLTTDRFAGERVREVLLVELAALGAFDVTPVGEVNRALRVQNVIDVTELDPDSIARVGTELGVQGLLLGSVMEYRERRTGSFTAPEIALSLRLVDVETGVVVWSVSDARTGIGLGTRLFGVGERTQTEVARDLVRQLMRGLYAMAGGA